MFLRVVLRREEVKKDVRNGRSEHHLKWREKRRRQSQRLLGMESLSSSSLDAFLSSLYLLPLKGRE